MTKNVTNNKMLNANIIPKKVATPLPPLNLKKIGKIWPINTPEPIIIG